MRNSWYNFKLLLAGAVVGAGLCAGATQVIAQQAGRELNVVESNSGSDLTRSPMNPDGRSEYVPTELRDVGVDEKPGATVPLDLKFTDEHGDTVRLADLVVKDRPIVLQLSYFDCPMLCELVSKGMVKAMNELKLEMGSDFAVLNVSFNPEDKYRAAELKKDAYLKAYDHPDRGGAAWHFLVGSAVNIDTLTKSVGFKYKWVPDVSQYSHPAVLFVLTSDGRVSNYVYGAEPQPKALNHALVEAGQGKIGTVMDRFYATCFHVGGDGKYTVRAYLLMRTAGVLTVIGIVTIISMLLHKEMTLRRTTGVAGGLRSKAYLDKAYSDKANSTVEQTNPIETGVLKAKHRSDK